MENETKSENFIYQGAFCSNIIHDHHIGEALCTSAGKKKAMDRKKYYVTKKTAHASQ